MTLLQAFNPHITRYPLGYQPISFQFRSLTNLRPVSSAPLSLCKAAKQIDDLKLGEDVPLTIDSISVGPDHSLSLISADVDVIMEAYIAAGQEDKDPYWTCVWPSSVSMAYELFKRPELVKGKRVADLGCGLGLAGLAAACAGAAEVVFLDREPLSLQCALLNASLNGFTPVTSSSCGVINPSVLQSLQRQQHRKQVQEEESTITSGQNAYEIPAVPPSACAVSAEVFDWSQPVTLERFDVVLACDVLYEAFSVEPVAKVVPKLLKTREGSRLLLSDPPHRAKANRDRFLQLLSRSLLLEECGLRSAQLWSSVKEVHEDYEISFMVLRTGCTGDTVGVKLSE